MPRAKVPRAGLRGETVVCPAGRAPCDAWTGCSCNAQAGATWPSAGWPSGRAGRVSLLAERAAVGAGSQDPRAGGLAPMVGILLRVEPAGPTSPTLLPSLRWQLGVGVRWCAPRHLTGRRAPSTEHDCPWGRRLERGSTGQRAPAEPADIVRTWPRTTCADGTWLLTEDKHRAGSSPGCQRIACARRRRLARRGTVAAATCRSGTAAASPEGELHDASMSRRPWNALRNTCWHSGPRAAPTA